MGSWGATQSEAPGGCAPLPQHPQPTRPSPLGSWDSELPAGGTPGADQYVPAPQGLACWAEAADPACRPEGFTA